ncbi:MAG: NAD(P)H-hydrate dehydratase [Chitinophagales bacterium]|nr:NAD(P)H-hydrate dehydratase [Chitinophagales bacterium]
MLPILTSQQIRNADQYTIEHEPIKSSDLMEYAAKEFCNELEQLSDKDAALYIFCGPGNNGGDGLAIARIAEESFRKVSIFILASQKYSDDFEKMLKRQKKWGDSKLRYIENEKDFPSFQSKEKNPKPIIIDALFGSGLNKPLSGLAGQLVNYLNSQNAHRISVDIPSGLFADGKSDGILFHAHHTITFQSPKLSFFFPENYLSVGEWKVKDIGLDQKFIDSLACKNYLTEAEDISQKIIPRKKFDHKGTFGHGFIHAGSEGKMGAAILCARACVNSGAGLTTLHIQANQFSTINISVPEVMTEDVTSVIDLLKYNAFAFGPGTGTGDEARKTFLQLLSQIKSPCVLDADALNILATEKDCWKLIPKNAVLTPHLKEFDRLAEKTNSWEERHNKQVELSQQHSVYIILKGAYTCITTPEGKSFFNSTGNSGMAKGGSGDVLTGMIVSLLAQKYSAEDACIVAVYLHGLAADIAVENGNEHSLSASDIINNISMAFKKVLKIETSAF